MTKTNRRRFLRGAGAALVALPMLEYFRASPAAGQPVPPRLLVYYMPNGRRPEWWVPTATADGLVFPGPTASLQPFANRALSLVSLDNIAARESPGAAHAMGTCTVMTGTRIPDLEGIKNGVSLDQIVANQLDPPTRFKSVQWSAGEPGPCDVGGASCAYTQTVAWAGAGQPLLPTIDPTAAFDRLFTAATDGLTGAAGEVRKRSVRSVLDYVRDDATSLGVQLGRDDRLRLDQYFTSLRELETSLSTEASSCAVPIDGPASRMPYPERVPAFHELIKLAFQCDQTRIMTFMIEFGLSGRSHDFLGAPGAHHALSHYGNDTDFGRLQTVETWQAQQIADLLQRLDGTPSTDGRTLLDDTIVLCIPSMGAGSNHDHGANCPLLFGGRDVIQATGRQMVLTGTPLANLHVTLLRIFGITGSFGNGGAVFGDYGTGEIAGIAV
jgi:hypothetical protein